MSANRSDPEKHKNQVRQANAARAEAVNQLITLHPKQFDRLYKAAASKRGVEPAGRRI